jgi:hypothetical protein
MPSEGRGRDRRDVDTRKGVLGAIRRRRSKKGSSPVLSENMTLLGPCFCISGLQNCKRINFYFSESLSGTLLWQFVTQFVSAALGN